VEKESEKEGGKRLLKELKEVKSMDKENESKRLLKE